MGRIIGSILLLPVVVYCLVLEVAAGTGTAWACFQPDGRNIPEGFAWFAFALIGPAVLVFSTIRSRSRIPNLASRALNIEKWTLGFGIPIGIASMFIIAVQSII
jgi:hypothetical protein